MPESETRVHANPTDYFEYSGWQDYAKEFHSSYPHLITIAKKLTHGVCRAVLEIIDRVEKVKKSDLFKSNKLSKIEPLGDADRHNDGRQVYKLHFKTGEIVVYKPTDVWSHIAFKRAAEICQLDILESCFFLAETYLDENGEFSLAEFIEPYDCRSDEEVKLFYKRLGHLLAMCQVLNCSDMHCGNIIASGAAPYFIDSECYFQNTSLAPDLDFDAHFTLLIQGLPNRELNEYWLPGICSDSSVSYDPQVPTVTDDDSWNMQLSLGKVVVSETSNIPKLNGNYVDPWLYSKELKNGYLTGIQKIIYSQKRLLEDVLIWRYIEKAKIRVLARRTSAYYQLYRRFTMPDMSTCFSNDNCTVQEYRDKYDILNSELKQLRNLDFPYFYTKLDSDKVTDIDGEVITTFPLTLRSVIRKSIESVEMVPIEETLKAVDNCLEIARQIRSGEIVIYEDFSN